MGLFDITLHEAWRKYKNVEKWREFIAQSTEATTRNFPKSFKNNKKGVRLFKKFLVVRQHSSQILAFSQSFSKCFSKFFLKIKAIYKSIITLDFRVFPRIAYNCLWGATLYNVICCSEKYVFYNSTWHSWNKMCEAMWIIANLQNLGQQLY